jgi:hypothetical protein
MTPARRALAIKSHGLIWANHVVIAPRPLPRNSGGHTRRSSGSPWATSILTLLGRRYARLPRRFIICKTGSLDRCRAQSSKREPHFTAKSHRPRPKAAHGCDASPLSNLRPRRA